MSDNRDLKTNYEKDLTNLGISIKKGETEKSLELIENIPVEHLFHPDENGRTHLQNAIRLEQNAVASSLIRKKNVTARQLLSRDKDGITALDDAIRLEKGSLIVEIFANKEINHQIQHPTLDVTFDQDRRVISVNIIPKETIEKAEKAIKSEITKLTKKHTEIDNKRMEIAGLKEMGDRDNRRIEEGKRAVEEIKMLDELYRNSGILINGSKQVRSPHRLLEYKEERRQQQ